MAKPRKRHEGDSSISSSPSVATAGDGSHGASPDPERVSMRAYELYLARGGSDGQAFDDWLTAERELSQRSTSLHGDSGE